MAYPGLNGRNLERACGNLRGPFGHRTLPDTEEAHSTEVSKPSMRSRMMARSAVTPATEILTELRRSGVALKADGDTLCLKPRRALDDALLARVRDTKPSIMEALRNYPFALALVLFPHYDDIILIHMKCWRSR